MLICLKKNEMKIFPKLFILLFFISSATFSQNFLHNSEQFGLRGSMLGGAVVAGAEDETMAFYNPAGIFKSPSQVSISLLQPEYKNFGFDKFWGNNEISELNVDYGLKPSVISFKFKIKDWNIAFLKISKSNLTDKFNSKREVVNNNIQTTQYFEYEYTGEDRWFGFGASLPISKSVHFGFSQFMTFSSFTYKNEILLEDFDTSTQNQVGDYFNSSINGLYSNIAFITKIGILFDTERHDFGFTITTPTYFRINKNGSLNSKLVNIGSTQNNAIQNIDNNLSPTIKTPWEFNFGYSFAFKNNGKLWLSSSYHTGISEYEMATIKTLGNNLPWMNGSKEVFNFNVGYSHKLSDNLELSGAFRTNNFAYENKKGNLSNIRNIILDGNHIHFVAGSKFKLGRHNVLLGIDWGTLVNVPNEQNFDLLSNIGKLSPNLQGLTKNSVSILFTYGFILDGLKSLVKRD